MASIRSIAITGIHIHDVKGIDDIHIACDFFPNRPGFLVAPNGTGKSSLAVAFSSLNRNRLKLDDTNLRRGTDGSGSQLEIRFSDGKTFTADARSNEIARAADVYVINSGLYARGVARNFGGHATASATIRVPDIEICKIPATASVPYKVSDYRDGFPQAIRKRVPNVSTLLKDPLFLRALLDCNPKVVGKRNEERVERFLGALEDASVRGVGWDLLDLPAIGIEEVASVVGVAEILRRHMPNEGCVDALLGAVQLCRLYEAECDKVRETCAWLEYRQMKKDVDELIASLNTTGITLASHAEKGKLVVRLPDRSQLSNGELDILNFASSMVSARLALRKDVSILVIDEVFDYLDDANLLVAQYYLLNMMDQYRRAGKALYTIILTHMDPSLMKSYRFKTSHVSYFLRESVGTTKDYLLSLLADREGCKQRDMATYEDISRRFLHYCPSGAERLETERYLLDKGFPQVLCNAEGFSRACSNELRSYLSGGEYDIAMVCCALRKRVEEKVCLQLQDVAAREEFLSKHGTVKKLECAEGHGAEVPELYYLLGGLYNHCMHPRGGKGEIEIAGRTLCNATIRRMIEYACE